MTNPERGSIRGLSPILKLELSFRELEAFTGPGLSVLLTFLHTRIARQETVLLQDGAQRRVRDDQSSSNAVPHGARLAERSAPGERGDDIEPLERIGDLERLFDEDSNRVRREIILELPIIDDDFADAMRQTNPGYGRFAPARCGIFCHFLCHSYFLSMLQFQRDRLLCRVRMLFAGIHFQTPDEGVPAQMILREHIFDRVLEKEFRLPRPDRRDFRSLMAAGI